MKSTYPILLASLISPLTTLADPPGAVLERSSVNAGGGTTEVGSIVLQATLGQAVADFATAGNAIVESGFWAGNLEVVVIYDNAFEEWMDNLPASEKPPEVQRGPGDMPAGDGVSNLLKYALGLMPMTPSADAAPRAVSVAATQNGVEQNYLAIELERSKDAAMNFQIEGSDDLTAWDDAPFATDILDPDVGDTRERIRLLSGIALNEHPKYFLRLRVSMP